MVENSPFARELQAAKARAEAKTVKHLSFTSSDGIKRSGSQSSFRGSSVSTVRSRYNEEDNTPSQDERRKKSGLSQNTTSTHHEEPSPPSNILLSGPEAQVAQVPIAPSGPSTDKLETDRQSLKFVSTDENEDSYLDLSTQAALVKAQESFQKTMISPLKDSPSRGNLVIRSQQSPTLYKTPKFNVGNLPQSLFEGLSKRDQPAASPKEPLNTQAMIDAVTPFAMTTVKKVPPSRTKPVEHQVEASVAHSPLPSPSHMFGASRRSLSMSTSESPDQTPTRRSSRETPIIQPPLMLPKASTGISKPLSPATSTAFSIAPNGTLSEVYQDDGQQRNDIQIGLDSGFDLDQALEEAGSFLETLDVEAAARKGGAALVGGSRG